MASVRVTRGKRGKREEGAVYFTPLETDETRGTLRLTGSAKFRRAFDRVFSVTGPISVGQETHDGPLDRAQWAHVRVAIAHVARAYDYELSWSWSGVPEEEYPADATAL